MSYNYLPLDRKWLSFQQVKNLLDYDQLVSITFDAHERILKSVEYLEGLQNKSNAYEIATSFTNTELANLATNGTGEKVPVEIVKMMLMLKIKSLSFGHCGVQIETVKRLMEMYNNGVFPVVRSSALSLEGAQATLSQLFLPLLGLGEVEHKAEVKSAAEVLRELKWQPLTLQDNEVTALIAGSHFTAATGLLILKKVEQLLKVAEVVASIFPGSSRNFQQVHRASEDAFTYVVNVFLKEINSVSEITVVSPDEDLVLNNAPTTGYHLAMALDFLGTSMAGIGTYSAKRTALLAEMKRQNEGNADQSFAVFAASAAEYATAGNRLAMPISVTGLSIDGSGNGVDLGALSAVNCLQLINDLEKVLAIEMIVSTHGFENGQKPEVSATINQFLSAFNQAIAPTETSASLASTISTAVEFISTYKF